MTSPITLKQRRLELGLSLERLASVAQLQPSVLACAEVSDDFDSLTIKQVRALGDAVGVDLLERRPPDPNGSDGSAVRLLGAAIAEGALTGRPVDDLSWTLQWSHDYSLATLEALRVKLRDVGLTVVSSERGGFQIRADRELIGEDVLSRLPSDREDSLSSAESAVLVEVVKASHEGQQLFFEDFASADQTCLRALFRSGMLTLGDDELIALSPIAESALMPILEPAESHVRLRRRLAA